MANINFSNLTAPNGALQDLKELIFLRLLENEQLSNIVTILPNQENGKKVGLLTGFGMLGKASQGCDPEFDNSLAATSEQTWEIKEWEIPEKICYTDLSGTMAEKARKKGVSVADLTGTFYIDNILFPMLERAIEEMLLRFAFFGDKDASVYDASDNTSGTLKPGMNADHFTLINGFWKLIFTAVAGGTISRTAIAANTQTTIALQKSAMTTSGVASDLFTAIQEDAPMVLQEAGDKVFLITKSLWNAWKNDVRKNNKGSEGQWESWFGGILAGEIDGIKTLVLPFWDKMIRTALQNTTNTSAYDKPYRCIYTTKDNLLVGTTSNGSLSDIDYWFEKKDQKNYILAKDTIGAMILDHNMIHVAY